jgi:hypothetical protein
MDLALAKLLLIIVLCTLIVFSGMIVPPAYRRLLDTWYGRLLGLIAVLYINVAMGWPMGMLAAMTLLILMPATRQEGFSNQLPPSAKAQPKEPFETQRVIPAEAKQRWFIERLMDETPIEIDTVNVETLPTQ